MVQFICNKAYWHFFKQIVFLFPLQCPTCGPIHLQQGPDSFRCFGPSLCCSPTKGCLSGSLPGKVSKDKVDSIALMHMMCSIPILCKSPDIPSGRNRSPIFLICAANNVVEHYRKELKSCMVILLSADLKRPCMGIKAHLPKRV